MSATEEQAVSEEEQCLQLFKSIGSDARELNKTVTSLLEKFKRGQMKLQNGHKLVGLKNHLLLDYIINLTHLMLKKVNGESIAKSNDRWRMIETRTVMEKMKGLESKFKHEIEKKLEEGMSEMSTNEKFDPCPKIDQAGGGKDEEEDDDDDDDDDDGRRKKNKSDIYQAPKMVPKFYDEDEPFKVKREKILEKAKKKALKSSLLNDIRNEYTDQPEEIYGGLGFNRAGDREKMNERMEYEEKYFTRMQMTKKDKEHLRKMRSLTSELKDIGRFSDVAVFTGQEESILKKGGKKRKSRLSKGGLKKKKPKFH